METNIFKLDNGKFLYRDYGKYRSGLIFISNKEFLSKPTKIITNKKPIKVKKLTVKIGKVLEYTASLSTDNETEGIYSKKISVGKYKPEWIYKEIDDIKEYLIERWGEKEIEKGFEIIDERESILYDIKVKSLIKPAEEEEIEIPYSGELIGIVEGKYRKNKKGTDIFDLTKAGDLLIIVDWGGGSSKSRGIEIDKIKNYKYYRHASSNGGGVGTDWLIIPKDFKLELSEDDF